MKVLHICSEMYPFVKTGGLADVVGSLPLAEAKFDDLDVRVLLPGYQAVCEAFPPEDSKIIFTGYILGEMLSVGVSKYHDISIYVIYANHLFYRDREKLYHDGYLHEYNDNYKRFGILSYIGVELCNTLDPFWIADLIHAHDWHAGLAPAYLKFKGYRAKSIFTIHNLMYQGKYDKSHLSELELPGDSFTPDGLEFYGEISYLKAGIVYADYVTTVSKTYATEILSPEFSYGFSGVLASSQNQHKLLGILNGADYSIWDPNIDPTLPRMYSSNNPRRLANKKFNKKTLQQRFHLIEDPQKLLVVVVSRLTDQKGIYLIVDALDELMKENIECIFLGSGTYYYENKLQSFRDKYPDRIGIHIGYDEDLAHQLIGGGDAMLIPSISEPCGLTQLFALKYGTLPLVRATGGLKDTVVSLNSSATNSDKATGFNFENPLVEDFLSAFYEMYKIWQDSLGKKPKKVWIKLQKNAMEQDFSWQVSAQKYRDLYKTVEQEG